MRLLVAVAPAAALLAAALALPSCSDDSSAATTDSGAGFDDDGMPEVGPPADSGPDSAVAASVEYRAGTRLHPIVTSGGGVELFSRLHDTLLDVDCTYTTLGDGALHCAPTSPIAGSVYFTDATCKQKIVAWQTTCAPPVPAKYALYTDYAVGCTTPEVLELGVASPPATTYELNAGACTVYAGPPLTYRSVTRTVPPAELVPATVAREARGPQLFATYLDGADGSRQPDGIEDAAPHAGPCAEAKTGDGTLRCAPTKLAFVEGLFSDATCAAAAAYQPGYSSDACKLTPTAILETAFGTCAGTYAPKYFEVGAKVAGTIYQGSPASCAPLAVPPAPGSSYFAKGAAIPETALATLKHVESAGTALALDSTTVETGQVLHPTSFWDPTRGAVCTPRKAADGSTRCMGRPVDTSTFADAGCTQPLVVIYHAAPGCAAPLPKHLWTEAPAPNNCGAGTVRGWTVGAKIAPPVQVYTGSSCSPVPADTASADYFAMTGELAPTDLVELTELTE